ncbi:unnamed protein product [Didymodactylos carnosus]|uniref:TLDc domain-containing protein n=1 Tax=Didymodactylos carnosus TaxID=1234261 RepID=A0A8S2S7K0_9BILA|nr:unnamed protein product [Didymodactylos carnosus]CAF4210016.1 unnamed protein product [Didymodactylos carnosus]
MHKYKIEALRQSILVNEKDYRLREVEKLKKETKVQLKKRSDDATKESVQQTLKDIEENFLEFNTFNDFQVLQLPNKPRVPFIGDGTLLTVVDQLKLNEFCYQRGKNWQLIYKATRDGFGAGDFHQCCDGQGPTITVIQTDGHLFGGYTAVPWSSPITGRYCEDPRAFLFTLTNSSNIPPTKFYIDPNESKYSVYHQIGKGPSFGRNDLHVPHNANSPKGLVTGNDYFYLDLPQSPTYIDTIGMGTIWNMLEIEIYKLSD